LDAALRLGEHPSLLIGCFEQRVLAQAFNGQTAGQKIGQQPYRFSVNPALGELAFLLHVDQTCSPKLLYVMGDGGRNDMETSAKVADTFPHLFIEAAQGAWRAARDKMQKDGEAIGIG